VTTSVNAGEHGQMHVRILLLFLFVVLYLAFLGVRPLFIPDEVRYGEIAREMIATGDWIVPRLNGLLYFEKPPLGHWLNAISLYLFGENPFAVRFASAMATGVSAMTVYVLGRRLFTDSRIAPLATFVFLTMFEVQAIGTFSVLDSIFSAVVNVGIACFIFAAFVEGRRQVAWLVYAGIGFGVAFLTKGFLGLALPVLVLAPWLMLTGRNRLLLVRSWIAVAAAGIIVAPWAIAIHQSQPDFWRYFFWVEHIQRFAADNAQHKQPMYFYLVFLPVVAFPWIFFLPAATRALRSNAGISPHGRVILLISLWAILPFAFFSIANGKLITYILPCFVPLSLMLAAGLTQKPISMRMLRYGMVGCILLLALAVAAVAYISFIAADVPKYGPDEQGKLALILVALMAAIGLLIFGGYRNNLQIRLLSMGLAMSVILVVLPWVIPEVTKERKAPVAFLQKSYAEAPGDVVVVTNGSLVRAASWATKRDDIYVIDGGGETTYGLSADDAVGRYLSGSDFSNLLDSGSDVLLLCIRLCSDDTLDRLPPDVKTSSYGSFSSYLVVRNEPANTPVAAIAGTP